MVPPQIGNLAWPQLLSLSSFASPLLSDRPGLGTCPFVCPLNLCRGMGVGGGPTIDSDRNTYNVVVRNTGFEVRQVRIQVLTLPLTICVILDELNCLSLSFFIYKMKIL